MPAGSPKQRKYCCDRCESRVHYYIYKHATESDKQFLTGTESRVAVARIIEARVHAPRYCANCGKVFTTEVSITKYCSEECAGAAYRYRTVQSKYPTRYCRHCGKQLAGMEHNTRYCNKECRDQACNERRREEHKRLRKPRYCTECGVQIPDYKHGRAKMCGSIPCRRLYDDRLKRKYTRPKLGIAAVITNAVIKIASS